MESIKDKVRAFIQKFYREKNFTEEDDIFTVGFANSLFSMQLVMFLESEFNIHIENVDLDINNFRTINRIASFIQEKKVGER